MVRWLVMVAFCTGLGCGPSLRMVHQSSAFFERCHAADYDHTVRPEERRACWAAWLTHYKNGQPPDRVAYAEGRLEAMDHGETPPPMPGLATSAVGSSLTVSILPTDGAATDGPDPAPESASPHGARPRPPAPYGACASVCTPRWNRCVDGCFGRHASCQDACETENRTCMAGCY